ncbi:MAG TPA: amidohydrolase [Anaerolineales bacterium]|nr:amidohydrolase [Anaerolineae bacterium]HIQ01848.1 amidohydrolase [Anaerolineales bacterium]
MPHFRTEAERLRDRLIAWRRDFHMHPELAFEEQRTAGIVVEHLERLGYRVRRGIAKTGVIGVLEGGRPGPVVMFRFDMDGLPVTEETGAEYASRVPGRMHACGHDGHVALGMGLAELLAARREEMAGTAALLFQPAEEGGNGAEVMVQEGALENPRPDVFLATHVWIEKPVGTVDVSPGPVMAAAEKWTCTIHGQGGHGALPQQAVDPIVAAAYVVTGLQTVVSRNVNPLDTAVVSVGSIHGGDAFNVIPPEVQMTGTIRTYQPATRETVLQRVREVIDGVATACGAHAELEITPLTPPVINDPEVVEVVRRAAEAVVGPEQVGSGERTMGSEDAAFFMEEVPGCYFFLGAANAERGLTAPHHNPRFDFDEESLVLGLTILAEAAGAYLL